MARTAKSLLIGALLGWAVTAPAQTDWAADVAAIRELLQVQTEAWNRGDIDGFMAGYWASDSLVFVGSRGMTYGYAATLANYRAGYPTPAAMGTLSFPSLDVYSAGPTAAYVVGTFHLQRSAPYGEAKGQYLLVLRKLAGRWVIVADHSS